MTGVMLPRADKDRLGVMLRAFEQGRFAPVEDPDETDDGGEIVGVCLETPQPVSVPTANGGLFSSGKFLALSPSSKTSTILWLTDQETNSPTFQLQVNGQLTQAIRSDAEAREVLAAIQALSEPPDRVKVLGPGSLVGGEEWPARVFLISSEITSIGARFVTENADTPASGGSRSLRFQPTRYVFSIVEYWAQADPWIAGRLGFFRAVPGVGYQLLNRETWGAL